MSVSIIPQNVCILKDWLQQNLQKRWVWLLLLNSLFKKLAEVVCGHFYFAYESVLLLPKMALCFIVTGLKLHTLTHQCDIYSLWPAVLCVSFLTTGQSAMYIIFMIKASQARKHFKMHTLLLCVWCLSKKHHQQLKKNCIGFPQDKTPIMVLGFQITICSCLYSLLSKPKTLKLT